jgi:predicted nucleotidyltransferase
MSHDVKSPLLKKRALDALLDTMADGLDGHDNYDELGAHRRGEGMPESKGTEFEPMESHGFAGPDIVTPPKESEPKFGAEEKLPSKDEILRILRQHPLVGLKEKPRRVFVIGSVARGEQRPDSDIDILLEVDGGGQRMTDFYRRKLQQYFVDNDLHGKHDEVHPQWNGRRVDVYTTSNADSDDRPKVKIGAVLAAPSKELPIGTPLGEVIADAQSDGSKYASADPVATKNPASLTGWKRRTSRSPTSCSLAPA